MWKVFNRDIRISSWALYVNEIKIVDKDGNLATSGTTSLTWTNTITWATTFGTTVNVASGGTIAWVGTGTNGIILKNLKNTAASALSWTQKDITIDIWGTPYYFTVYPTKA